MEKKEEKEKTETEKKLAGFAEGGKIGSLFEEAQQLLLTAKTQTEIDNSEEHLAEIMLRLDALGAVPSDKEIAKVGPKIWDSKLNYAIFRRLFFNQMKKLKENEAWKNRGGSVGG